MLHYIDKRWKQTVEGLGAASCGCVSSLKTDGSAVGRFEVESGGRDGYGNDMK
jgi:hypothetical protein